MRIFNKANRGWLPLALCGFLAGAVNGLLGAGGGIIIIFALNKILGEESLGKNGAYRHALCVMLPISILSVLIYSSRGHVSMDGFGVFIIPALLGGAVGGLLLGKLNSMLLKRLFAGLIVVSGILLIVR